MRRGIDVRRVPLSLLFLGTAGAVFGYLLSSYSWLLHYNLRAFVLHALVLVPVAGFFAGLATLIFWYLFRIALPGLFRFRRLRMIRYQRALRSRGNEENPDQTE